MSDKFDIKVKKKKIMPYKLIIFSYNLLFFNLKITFTHNEIKLVFLNDVFMPLLKKKKTVNHNVH